MVHLLATIANDADFMPAHLHALRGFVQIPEPAASAEVWGVGYFADGRGLIVRKPAALLEERSAYAVAGQLQSRIVFTCARSERAQSDAPPYRFRRWLFGFAGGLEALGPLQGSVADRLPSFVRDVLGDEHGGRLAHAMFLAELHRADLLEDPLADPVQVGAALARTAETLARLGPEAGVSGFEASFVASNGRGVVVSRAGRPLWMREVNGLERLPEGPVDETLNDFKRVAEALKRFRAHVVAGDVAEDASGWTALPPRGTTVFEDNMEVRHL